MRSARRIAPLVAALALAPALASPAIAAPGIGDPAFGPGGQASLPFSPAVSAAGIAAIPGGGFAIAGTGTDSGGEGVFVARLDAAAAPDPAFAGRGFRLDRFGTSIVGPQRGGAVAVQADGKIVIAGVSGDALMLARFMPDGTLDPLFGAAGVALRDRRARGGLLAGAGATAIAIAPNGQIVVAGATGTPDDPGVYESDALFGEQVLVARYSDAGVPDPAFGRDGFAAFQLGAGSPHRRRDSAAGGLALLPDGRIVIAGRASDRRGADRAFVARLTANGALDQTFAGAGRLLIQLGRASAARPPSSGLNALAALADGSFLTTGSATDVSGSDAVLLARFNATGQLSGPGFGRGGAYVTQLGPVNAPSAPQGSIGRALVVQDDGNAVVAGSARGGALVARVNAANGRLDCGYGDGGRTILPTDLTPDPADYGAAGALPRADGAVLLGGGGRGQWLGTRLLLARVLGGPSTAAAAQAPRLRTLRARYLGRGRAYAYAYVDGRCRSVGVRITVQPAGGGTIVRSGPVRVPASVGPRVICVPIRGLRAGAGYRIGVVSSTGTKGSMDTLRARRRGAPALAQDDCGRP